MLKELQWFPLDQPVWPLLDHSESIPRQPNSLWTIWAQALEKTRAKKMASKYIMKSIKGRVSKKEATRSKDATRGSWPRY